MFVFIALVLALYMFLVFRKYRTIPFVIIAIASLFLITTAITLWGAFMLSFKAMLSFFSQSLGPAEFYLLMAAWYAGDVICSFLIIRRYLDYREINGPPSRGEDRRLRVTGTPREPGRR
ncbi:MAG: hypothetical protein JW838_04815 [Spirochaetes bacterium]|nr:hypothetical protein [Spirochaetota bacterium]